MITDESSSNVDRPTDVIDEEEELKTDSDIQEENIKDGFYV